MVNSSGDFKSITPPPIPRCDFVIPARLNACKTLDKYAGGTRVTSAICSVVLAFDMSPAK
jgi:hypothetical protein